MPEHASSIDCLTAVRQLWDYLDEELTADRMQVMEQHLEACSSCCPHSEFAERLLLALRETRVDTPCPAEVRRKVIQVLREAGMQTS